MTHSRSDTVTPYNDWADDYDRFRHPSHVLVRTLHKILAPASKRGPILSLGCGTGQYEAVLGLDRIVGLDKSPSMLRIARNRVWKCVLGDMRDLPFPDGSFVGVYLMQSLHHVGNNFNIDSDDRRQQRKRVLTEAFRVLSVGPVAIVQRDPSQNRVVWFWKYFPEALRKKLLIQPQVSSILAWLAEVGFAEGRSIPLDDPMIKGFCEPQAPLDPGFRRSFSEFSYLSQHEIARGVKRLTQAIQTGAVSQDIADCKARFAEIGGTVFLTTATKP